MKGVVAAVVVVVMMVLASVDAGAAREQKGVGGYEWAAVKMLLPKVIVEEALSVSRITPLQKWAYREKIAGLRQWVRRQIALRGRLFADNPQVILLSEGQRLKVIVFNIDRRGRFSFSPALVRIEAKRDGEEAGEMLIQFRQPHFEHCFSVNRDAIGWGSGNIELTAEVAENPIVRDRLRLR